MSSSRMIYYILGYGDDKVVGPLPFRTAVQLAEQHPYPCEILKLVVDYHGKEVK